MAAILEEIAFLLELAGENPFKVRAYEAGARAVLTFPGDLEEAVRSGELARIKTVASLFPLARYQVEGASMLPEVAPALAADTRAGGEQTSRPQKSPSQGRRLIDQDRFLGLIDARSPDAD